MIIDTVVPRFRLLQLVKRCAAALKCPGEDDDGERKWKADGDITVSASERVLGMRTDDKSRSMYSSIEADSVATGTAKADAGALLRCVRAMPDGPVQLTVSDDFTVTVKAVGRSLRCATKGSADNGTATASSGDMSPVATIAVSALRRLIAQTRRTISEDETRPHVNCVALEFGNGRVRAISTDGHRMSISDEPASVAKTGSEPPDVALVPWGAAVSLRGILETMKPEDSDMVTIRRGAKSIVFEFNDTAFSAKLNDAAFPLYRNVVPRDFASDAKLPLVAFYQAVKTSLAFVGPSFPHRGIRLTLAPGHIRVAVSSDTGYDLYSCEVGVDYSGPEKSANLDPRYVLDAAGVIEEPECMIGLGVESNFDPVTFTPAEETENYLAVVMPMCY